MGKKNKNKQRFFNNNTLSKKTNYIENKPSTIESKGMLLTTFDENEETDPGLDTDGNIVHNKPNIPIIINSIPKRESHPCDNPVFCRLANEFVLKFDLMTRSYIAWKHREFDHHLLGLRTDLINKMYSLQWIAKEMRDLLPRELHRNQYGDTELVPNLYYESLYQQLMPCDNSGILSKNPDERDEALFRLEQERDSLRNLIRGMTK